MTHDTVVVAAGGAWDYYLRHAAYVCQAGRSFRVVRWMGFYRQRRIEALIPEIVEHRSHVVFTRENATRLAVQGQKNDTKVANVIRESLGEGSRAEGAVHDVFLLTASDDPHTNHLAHPITHDGSTAWTMGQRYASLDRLLRARTTDGLNVEKTVPPITEADLLGPIHVIRQLRAPVRTSLVPVTGKDKLFVQFMHPGREHGEDRPRFKDWNVHDHRRKFMRSRGQYLRRLGEGPRHDRLVFWGEWEPESQVEGIAVPVPNGPRWLHTPYYVRPDAYTREGRVLQNTDPYVFGKAVQYTLCRQLRRGRPTFLRDLAPGSLILFGSSKDGAFVLDTVLVVAEGVLHTDEDWRERLDGRVDETYADVTLLPTYEWGGAELRHYRGATPAHKVGDMFSFAPCLPSDEGSHGFARPTIRLESLITQNLKMGAKATRNLSSDEIHELWLRVVEQVFEQGLCLGVQFDTPRRMPSQPEPDVPGYVSARIRKSPPPDSHVLPRSTPVVAFGDPRRARVATLGLNPSRIEFYENGTELDGSLRRFETLDSLGVNGLEAATDAVVDRVFQRCIEYFQGNPYRRWFTPLEQVLNAVNASYFDFSACHLDLTQWATDPTWNSLPSDARVRLVEGDVDFLREQLRVERIELLLLNGRRVIDGFRELLGGTLHQEPSDVQDRSVRAAIHMGAIGDARVIGWSTNLQSSFGVTRLFRQRLAERVGELARSG